MSTSFHSALGELLSLFTVAFSGMILWWVRMLNQLEVNGERFHFAYGRLVLLAYVDVQGTGESQRPP